MIKSLLPATLVLFAVTSLHAQRISSVHTQGPIGQPSRLKMDCNKAGTAAFGALTGQSTDFMGDTIYLCFNDTIPLIHNGDQDLSGDPDTTTTPGIGYSVYICPPTVSGPDLATIVNTDPCVGLITNPINGSQSIATVAGPTNSGNTTFFNSGGPQSLFGGGGPVQLWFAPLTYDTLVKFPIGPGDTLYLPDYESDGMGGPAGPCVNANIADFFSVVYLNPIEAGNISVNGSTGGCTGSFLLEGGLPEFNPNVFYTANITLATDPNVRGTVARAVKHGQTLQFTAPQPGIYNVEIEDGKSCGTSFQINMSGCEGVTFKAPFATALPGERICLPIKVEGFSEVGSFQFTMQFDPNVIAFSNVENIAPSIANNFDFFHLVGEGKVTFSWANAVTAVSLAENETAFNLCFTVIGSFGEESPITFVNSPTPIQIGDIDTNPYGFVPVNGLVRVTTDEIIAAPVQDSVSCPGLSDGGFSVRMFGGTAPYSMTWGTLGSTPPFSNGPIAIANQDSPVFINNLSAGDYVIEVTDATAAPNVIRDTVTVLEDVEFAVLLNAAANPLCFGDSTGTIQAQVTQGGVIFDNPETVFSFQWNVPGETGSKIDSIPSGTYSVTVTDPKGCTNTATGGLSQPAPLAINFVDPLVNATCSGSADGSFSIRATGGVSSAGNYFYQWADLPDADTTSISARTNLNPGPYAVTVTDLNGCEFSRSFNVSAPKILTIDSLVIDATCNGLNNGRIEVTGRTRVNGSVIPNTSADIPYTFTWSGNSPVSQTDAPDGTASTANSLLGGTYTLVMRDQDPAGCNVGFTFTVEEPDSLQVAIVQQVDESCNVGNDGAITVEASGGTPNYQYLWGNGQTTPTLTNLTAGDYPITVTDANGCEDSFTVTLTAPQPPIIDPIETDTVSCTTSTDGSLTVFANPGAAPITGYNWSNGASGDQINNLSPGSYIVSVTAADGCVAVDTGFVATPPPLQLDSLRLDAPSCPGEFNGAIAVFASGGTRPYQYTWEDPAGNTTNLAFNLFPGLSAGVYQLTITDANNCDPFITSVTLEDPPSIEITFTNIVGTSCFEGVCDGEVTASARYSDGTAGSFNFIWETGEEVNGVDISTVTNLCAQAYTLVVTDGNQCVSSSVFQVPSPEEIQIDVNTQPVSCNGLSDGSIELTVSGGTGPFIYTWPNIGATSRQVSNLAAGTYNAIVTDSRGCQKTQIVALSEPDPLVLSIDTLNSQLNVSCSGDSDARITLTYNSQDNVNPLGANPYTWEGGIGTSDSPIAGGLSPGTYSATLTDSRGCTDDLSFTIGEPQPIVFSLQPITPPLCFGDPTVIRIDTITGGSGVSLFDYTFMIDNNGFSFLPDQDASVFAGPHTVTVEDPAGCTESVSVNISQPRPITVAFDSTVIVVELGDSTVQLNPIIDADLPIGLYNWTPADGLSAGDIENPFIYPTGSYNLTLTVTDLNGCIGSGSVFVELDVNRNFYIPNAFAPNGDQFLNQAFRVFSCAGVKQIKSAYLYDRWGDLLFQSGNLAPNCQDGTILWDGKFNNKLMNPGVYVYLIEVEFEDQVTLLYRGDVTLVR